MTKVISKRTAKRRYAKQCKNKIAYDSKEQAETAMQEVASYSPLKPFAKAYPCGYCKKWHWGSSKKKKSRRLTG